MNVLSLDLEMLQPSNTIVQIGAVVGNIHTGEITDRLCMTINTKEQISPFIEGLIGVSQKQLDESPFSLKDGYDQLQEMHKNNKCLMNPLTWGGGDAELLRAQLGMDNEKWIFGRRWIDVKTLFVSRQLALGLPYQGGLASSMMKLGLKFEGRKHNALCDAENTFRIYLKLLENFKERGK